MPLKVCKGLLGGEMLRTPTSKIAQLSLVFVVVDLSILATSHHVVVTFPQIATIYNSLHDISEWQMDYDSTLRRMELAEIEAKAAAAATEE